jgi:hypothetical protein
MTHFHTTIKFEDTTFETKINVIANGKEEAIDKALEKLWELDFRRYMNVSKVEVKEV